MIYHVCIEIDILKNIRHLLLSGFMGVIKNTCLRILARQRLGIKDCVCTYKNLNGPKEQPFDV